MMDAPAAPLNILCFGAGAIGTYIGGSLLLSGQRVTFLERPDLAGVLRDRGLRLNLGSQVHVLSRPPVVDSLAAAHLRGRFDVALFALKSFDTRPALDSLAGQLERLPPFLCLSNGVENETELAKALGEQRVIAGTVTSAVGRGGPGEVTLERLRGMGVTAGHPLSGRLVEALSAAGLKARLFPQAAAMKWSKLLSNLPANASSAILGMKAGEVFAHPGLCQVEMRMLQEALAVMAAQGIQVVDLPGTPVRLLALAARFLPPGLSRPFLQRAIGSGRGGKMPSFYIDLHSGRGQSEVDFLNGAVVRFGERCGISTPVNRVLTTTLLDLTAGRLPLESFSRQPEKLLARLATEA